MEHEPKKLRADIRADWPLNHSFLGEGADQLEFRPGRAIAGTLEFVGNVRRGREAELQDGTSRGECQ
jgi:hypothetical protein